MQERTKGNVETKAEEKPTEKPADETKPKGEVLAPEKKVTTEVAKNEPLEVGEKDPESGRTILQPTNDAEENQELATEGHKEVLPGIKQLVASTDGAEMAGAREEKDPERTQEKVEDEGKPPATIPDYSAARIAVDTPQAKDDIVRLIKDKYPVVKEKNEFEKGSPQENFAAHMLQVQSKNGSTHEIQVLPKEVAAIAEPTHELYEQARGGDKDAQAELKEQNTAALEKFKERNSEYKGLDSTAGKTFRVDHVSISDRNGN
jgi:hypothetical protein